MNEGTKSLEVGNNRGFFAAIESLYDEQNWLIQLWGTSVLRNAVQASGHPLKSGECKMASLTAQLQITVCYLHLVI